MGRVLWGQLPVTLREEVEALLGGVVVRAETQASGWSPGSADRIVTSDGDRAFVKTISRSVNSDGYELHQREARVMSAMPSGVRVPQLLGVIDRTTDGDEWIALVFADVSGRHPAGSDDVIPVLDALETLPLAAGPLRELPRAGELLRPWFGAWSRMQPAGVPSQVPRSIRAWAPTFAELERNAASLVDGDHLVHFDCRSDNLLVDDNGQVWVIDWPWAAVGAPWFDALSYLLDARLRGEHRSTDRMIDAHPLFAAVPKDTVDAVLVALSGMYFEKAAQPPPPAMPTLRQFQYREATAAADWALSRLSATRWHRADLAGYAEPPA